MSESLTIVLPQHAYAPGAYLQGSLAWQGLSKRQTLRLTLSFITEGKGTSDTGIEHEQDFSVDPGDGSREFSVTLPETPYSFHGHLISLHWRLEVTSENARVATPLYIAPDLGPIELPLIDEGSRESVSLHKTS